MCHVLTDRVLYEHMMNTVAVQMINYLAMARNPCANKLRTIFRRTCVS